MIWALNPGIDPEMLGIIPTFLDENDPRPAHEQLDENYQHGGGWRPMDGFALRGDNALLYPGDPALEYIAQTWLRGELVLVYPYSLVAVIQRDRSFEVCRMD